MCGVLDANEQLMSLRDQQDPVVTIREEEGESQRIDRVEDNEVMRDLRYGATRHISRDNVLYTDRSHTT